MWGRGEHNLNLSAVVLIHLTLLVLADPAMASDEGTVRSTREEESVIKAGDERMSSRPHITQLKDGDMLEVQEGEQVLLECTSLGPTPNLELVWRNGKVARENFDIQEDI